MAYSHASISLAAFGHERPRESRWRRASRRIPTATHPDSITMAMQFSPRTVQLCAALFLAFAAAAITSPLAAQVPPVVPGFPNVPQTPGNLLSGLNAPNQGRTAILAYHNGLLFTVPEAPASQPGSDLEVRTWNISDPTNPIILAEWGTTPMPVNAHGYLHNGPWLILGANWPPGGEWSFLAGAPNVVTRGASPNLLCAGVRGCLFQPWFIGDTFWSYNVVAGNATISRNWQTLSTWDHLGLTGVIGHPFLLGDLLIFASDQSRTGVATYDVSDPTNPVLLDVLTTGGPGGYWPELWGGDGKLYVVFPYQTEGNGFRVVDATDPSDLRFVTDRPLPGAEAMYAQFQDEYAFIGDHKVDMRTFESALFLDGANVQRTNDGGTGINTSQFALPIGNLLVTGGIGQHQGMAIWVHQAEPDTRGPSVGYHVPQTGRTNYPLGMPISLLIHETLETKTLINGTTFFVRPLGQSGSIAGQLTFSFDDVLTFSPNQPLQANTTYEVYLPGGTDSIKDAAGNSMEQYSFTFSTGSTVAGNQPPQVTAFQPGQVPVAPEASVTLLAAATDPDLDSLEYRFDFGDGSPKTAWASSSSVQAAYDDRGHYRATVQVRDTSGAIATRSVVVTVTEAPPEPLPTHSSGIVCHESSRRVWLVNPDSDTVAAIDADSRQLELEVPACADPRGIAVAGNGDVWVTCHDGDAVVVLDGGSGAPLAQLATGYGSAPIGIAASPDGATLYVTTLGNGELLRFDAATRSQTGALALGPKPRAIAVSGDGASVLVTRFLSPRDHAEIWEVDAATFSLVGTYVLPKFGGDANRDGTSAGRGVLNYVTGIAITPDGRTAWVAGTKPNVERGLLFGPDLDDDNTVRTAIAQVDLDTGELLRGIDVDNSDSSHAIAFSPLGDYLLVALQGNDEVMVLDALAFEYDAGLGSLVAHFGVGSAPQGLCVDAATQRVFTQNLMSRDATVLEAGELFELGNIAVDSTSVDTVGTELMSATVLRGKQLFYHAGDPRMSGEGYLSCASCHLDGGHDGRTWDFTGRGEGLRNTATLHGRAGTAHGNVHWTANFDEIQDFENDIRGAFGGLGFLSNADFAATEDPLGTPKAGLDPDLDALAAYVSSLAMESLPRSPFRAANGAMTPQALAGRDVFQSLGCESCHSGPQRTDSTLGEATLHDVGTIRTTSGQRIGGPLTGIDTPTLLGVWDTAPYFHDGSAATLEDVLRVAGGVVIPAEDGAVANGAQIVQQWVELNNDDTVHGRALVYFDTLGEQLTLSNVDGGPGGIGALEVRYGVGDSRALTAIVNGTSHTLALPSVGNYPLWRHTNWGTARLEGVSWNAGSTNTVVLTVTGGHGWPNISLDEVVISTAADLTAAQPHRVVLQQSQADRDALLAYLRQLDGRPSGGVGGGEVLFSDDLELGNLSRWSRVSGSSP
jgi:DNA-binding beta-propeller fold protein YncE